MSETASNLLRSSEVANLIRTGELDCNNRSVFLASVVRGLILSLNSYVKIRNKPVHHEICNTGDDTVWVINKGQDYSIEPHEVSNENYQYEAIPHCHLTIGSIDTQSDRLTSPYARGEFQIEYGEGLYTMSAECRRMPLRIGMALRYEVDSYRDLLELMQVVISDMAYVRTYKISYLGQIILCSYKIPEAYNGEHMSEMDGTTTDSKNRILELQLEVETNFPSFNKRTVVGDSKVLISASTLSIKNHEVAKWYSSTGTSH